MISADFIRQTGLGKLVNFNSTVSNVVIDSRKVTKKSMFIALPGENTDGHRFIFQAIKDGAALCIVSQEWAQQNNVTNLPLWIVDSPQKALQELSKKWREQFDIPVLAITGTNGKTTTRAMCSAILQKKYRLHTTTGNLNNHLGLPLTLLKMRSDHEFGILEIGTNHFGEIAFLCDLCKPSAGLITNIGHGHTEFFGSKEGVAKAKRELFDSMGPNGTSFINLDDEFIAQMNPQNRKICFGFNVENADYNGKISNYDQNACATLIINSTLHIKLKVPGYAMAQNALAAVAIGKTFDVDDQDIIDALESFDSVNQRFNVSQTKHCRIINDAYNANPDSTKAAIDTFSRMAVPGRRIFVFGDMFELGKLSQDCHEKTGQIINKSPIDLLFTYGPLTQITHNTVEKAGKIECRHFSQKRDLIAALKAEIQADDTLLIKGSRGNKLEEIIEGIAQ
ncbi:MAG: UDP-N-acetylmuramoyl-tripeptide--D-alanyl-D-alanine ligase [Candidatus Marinimicrobia bacterium]|nr:UDP-N-acetylmuramoyl-tripeptide--D-alanyl-D-alanine ligase [Candidatus Neomarinimicrobiota bacterium]